MRGTVYVLKFPDGKFYIGSTVRKLYNRFWVHKRDLNAGVNSKLYQYWRESGLTPESEVIDEIDVDSLKELHCFERQFLDLYLEDPDCLNTYKPHLTDQERKLYNAFHSLRWRQNHL